MTMTLHAITQRGVVQRMSRCLVVSVGTTLLSAALWLVQFALLERILFEPAPKEFVA